MKRISFPTKISSEINGYEELLRFHNNLEQYRNEVIEISLKNIKWFEANLVAILGAIIEDLESRGNKVMLVDYVQENDILIRNEFLTGFGFPISFSSHSTQIPYRKFKENQPDLYNEYIQKELLDKKEFPKHSVKLGYEIKRNIYELFENARTHGSCKNIHTCGQFYPNKKRLHITIVDTGKTIVNNVRNYLKKDSITPTGCIDWAMKTGNTTKTGNISGGLGLGLIFEFITLNQGKIQIISSNGYWELREGKINKIDLNFSFSGTIANLEFNLEEDKLYSLVNEGIDLNNIF